MLASSPPSAKGAQLPSGQPISYWPNLTGRFQWDGRLGIEADSRSDFDNRSFIVTSFPEFECVSCVCKRRASNTQGAVGSVGRWGGHAHQQQSRDKG